MHMLELRTRAGTWHRVGRRWGWLGLVPGMFVLNLGLPEAESLPTGIPEALGCSGSGGVSTPSPLWRQLERVTLPGAEEGAPQPVDTSGFFLVSAYVNELSPEQAQAQIVLHVSDGAGAEVPGDLRLLAERRGTYTFGWSAREPRALGERLNVALSVDPSASGAAGLGSSFELAVVAAPEVLPEPELALTRWNRY